MSEAVALQPCVGCNKPKDTIFGLRCSRCAKTRKLDQARQRAVRDKLSRASVVRVVFTEEESREIHARAEKAGVDARLLVKALVLREIACLPK